MANTTAPMTQLPGNLYVVSAPSGAGKSSLVKALRGTDSRLAVSVSHTTRAPRGQEQNGQAYWFINTEQFQSMIAQGDFLEWAQVHGNYYGTSKNAILQHLQAGQDVILEIDWQGALQIKEIFAHAVLIFILPPSWDELHQRLIQRNEDSPEIIEKRMANARTEVARATEFDYLIINASFHEALQELQSVVQSQRLRIASQRMNRPEIFSNLNL